MARRPTERKTQAISSGESRLPAASPEQRGAMLVNPGQPAPQAPQDGRSVQDGMLLANPGTAVLSPPDSQE